MSNAKVITGIDIGTSKISVVVCQMKSTEDIEILGMGTSVLKGIQKGVIIDQALFSNALQNCLKRAQAASDQLIEDVFINVPCGNSRYTIQTGIIQNESQKSNAKVKTEAAMKKAVHCIDKKNQSILHLFPINQRLDGQNNFKSENNFHNLEVDTGIVLCDSENLNIIFSLIRKMGLKTKGVISDYLSMAAPYLFKDKNKSQLFIDIGAQTTSFCLFVNNQLRYGHTILIGSEQITHDLSVCLKCSISEAERIKVLHGQLNKLDTELSNSITIQTHNGPQVVKISLITSIIESRVNQLFQMIQKCIIHAPNYDEIFLIGSGSNLKGLSDWVEQKLSRPIYKRNDHEYNNILVNSNYMIAMGQIIYGYQIGLLKSSNSSILEKLTSKIFKN